MQYRVHYTLVAGLLVGLSLTNASGQFSSGSDGSYGAMNITTNTTLDLPTNGVFNCTTITIAANATLRFNRNPLNTPVYLLATNDVSIAGTIDVSGSSGTSVLGGAAGPGGFDGGNPPLAGLPAGDGKGPGAGHAGSLSGVGGVGCGCYGSLGDWIGSTNTGTTYGSPLLIPLVGGSGGGARSDGFAGGGGGGAILIASSTRVELAGKVSARGANINDWASHNYGYNLGVGSGGAIRLVAPVIGGAGSLDVRGGQVTTGVLQGSSAGAGRIRIDCIDRGWLALSCKPAASVGAYMVVFPTNAPRLDITQVAGNNIPVGTSSSVFFLLPENAPTNQTVTVQASNFKGLVPIRVVLTPDNGSSVPYDAEIDNNTNNNPASVTVPVVVPINVRVRVDAWSR